MLASPDTASLSVFVSPEFVEVNLYIASLSEVDVVYVKEDSSLLVQ